MIEIEIKAYVSEHDRLTKALEGAGFTKAKTVWESDVYYNGVDRDFFVTDEALRIRRINQSETGCAALTYKGRKLEVDGSIDSDVAKARTEHETVVADAETMNKILLALGHIPVSEVCKKRIYYERGNITVCLDEVKGLGFFVELEIMDGNAEQLTVLVEVLGINKSDCTKKSYLEMLLEKENT